MNYITRRYLLSKRYARYLRNWEWEWFGSFTFSTRRRFGDWLVKRHILKWTRNLCIGEHIQVGYFYVLCWNYGHPHVHLLMIGRGRSDQGVKTLGNVCGTAWAMRWPFYAKIESPISQVRVVRYFTAHLYRKKCFRYEIDSYNTKLLRKLKTCCN